jgi:transcriptional regulator with XRE-family HTH domain
MPVHMGIEGEAFGDRLRALRERAGPTQEELASRAGLTPNAVSALERGTRPRPYPHTVRSLAEALQLSNSQRAGLIAAVPKRRNQRPEHDRAEGGPPDRRVDAVPDVDLVVPPTPLFGREDDIAEVARLARSGRSRLLTLTGPGGVGKTRLAVAVGQELAPDFPDGVVRISLATLADADDVIGTIGRALKVGAEGVNDVSLLAQQISQRRLLLVLDNFEHLLSAAADVGRLVANARRPDGAGHQPIAAPGPVARRRRR